MNITFYNHKVDKRIPEMQKKVFNAFGMDIMQIYCEDWKGHAGEVDYFLNNLVAGTTDIIHLWDIDCIPLNSEIVPMLHELAENGTIASVAQKASHIPNSIIYASPACIAFSYRTWEKLGKPSFQATDRSDCGGELTHKARELGTNVFMLYPKTVEQPKWHLDGEIMFGMGTNYQDQIYHAFLSRKDNTAMFIKKCEEVLQSITR
jgi:hypothetical protein